MSLLNKVGYIPKRENEIFVPKNAKCCDISIVIPVKNDQDGINLFLLEFFKTQENYPKEIIIVDNNSSPPITMDSRYTEKGLRITVLNCSRKGPASARNMGATVAQGDWIVFTDSDCIPMKNFLKGYLRALDGSIGYAGRVNSLGKDPISRYYETQEILIPIKNYQQKPEYLVTANCMVWKRAFELIGGFNENIKIAGGEDIDMSFRLLEIGRLNFADSIVLHNFNDGFLGFAKRFYRYGIGNRVVSELHGLDLLPKRFSPKEKSLINSLLAHFQFFYLWVGYKSGLTSPNRAYLVSCLRHTAQIPRFARNFRYAQPLYETAGNNIATMQGPISKAA